MNSGAISQPKASTITSVGAFARRGRAPVAQLHAGAAPVVPSRPGPRRRPPTGARAGPCPASWVARRQHTPMSPKLSITRQNTSHCNLGWVVKGGGGFGSYQWFMLRHHPWLTKLALPTPGPPRKAARRVGGVLQPAAHGAARAGKTRRAPGGVSWHAQVVHQQARHAGERFFRTHAQLEVAVRPRLVQGDGADAQRAFVQRRAPRA